MPLIDTPRPAIDDHVVSLVAPSSFGAEQYRRLRSRIEELRLSRGAKVIAVTSAVANDGKTLTAVNLAASLARGRNARVLLIDADVRQPSVGRRLGIDAIAGKGLAAALAASSGSIGQFVQALPGRPLDVLATGHSQADPYELLSSPRLETLFTEARELYDFVIVDTPPVIPVPDAGLLRRAIDGYVLVVSAGSTPRKLLGEALNLLEPNSVLGLIFNRDERPLFGYYGGRYRQYFQNYVKSLESNADSSSRS
jgi:capsular exopolysaccharide synthesis family protein